MGNRVLAAPKKLNFPIQTETITNRFFLPSLVKLERDFTVNTKRLSHGVFPQFSDNSFESQLAFEQIVPYASRTCSGFQCRKKFQAGMRIYGRYVKCRDKFSNLFSVYTHLCLMFRPFSVSLLGIF